MTDIEVKDASEKRLNLQTKHIMLTDVGFSISVTKILHIEPRDGKLNILVMIPPEVRDELLAISKYAVANE